MDLASFNKELSKYKVVRSEDFCRSREKTRVNSLVSKAIMHSGSAVTAKLVNKVDPVVNDPKKAPKELSFWATFENALAQSNSLSTREITNLISTMRKLERNFVDSVNLDDLELAAVAIQGKS